MGRDIIHDNKYGK